MWPVRVGDGLSSLPSTESGSLDDVGGTGPSSGQGPDRASSVQNSSGQARNNMLKFSSAQKALVPLPAVPKKNLTLEKENLG